MNIPLNTTASVEALLTEVSAVIAKFDLDFTEQRYQVLTKGYAFAHACHIDANKADELIDALIKRQIEPAKAGSNSFLPIMRAATGEFDETATQKVSFKGYSDLTPFKQNRSWDKYAAVWRYAYKAGIAPDDFYAWLVNFKDEKGRRGLNAIINADRLKYGTGPRTKKPALTKEQLQQMVDEARTMPSLSIAASADGPVGGYRLARVFIEDGVVYFHGLVKDSEKAALKAEVMQADPAVPAPTRSPEFIAAREQQAQAMAATKAQQANRVAA